MNSIDVTLFQDTYAGCGKPAVPPELLLRIVLFEIMDGRPSPAQWYRDLKVNDNLKYLGRFIAPSRSTCYEFRDRIAKKIESLHELLLRIAQDADLLSPEEGVLDGTYFRSLGSRHRMLNEEQVNQRAEQLEQAIKDPQPLESLPTWMGKSHEGRKRQAKRYRKACEVMRKRHQENAQRPKDKQLSWRHILVSPSDPEACISRDKEKVFGPIYNVQNLVDPKSLFIIATDVFNSATDSRKLGFMIDLANRFLNVPLREVWADAGYCSILDIQDANARTVELFAPFQSNSMTAKNKQGTSSMQIPREEFTYLEKENAYQCPAGHIASCVDKQQVWRSGNERLTEYRYRMNPEHCGNCPLKDRCLRRTSKSRTIKRLQGHELIESMKQKMETAQGKERSKKRGQIIERTFADTKQHRSIRKYHGYGLDRVKAENGLVVLVQNVLTLHRTTLAARKTNENAAA